MPSDIHASVARHFQVTEHANKIELRCKVCLAAWEWPRHALTVGAVLHLLNHAASHEQPKGGRRAD